MLTFEPRVQPSTAMSTALVGAVLLAGVAGGTAWAALVALLRDRADADEILVSLRCR